ncbi:MAG: CBS domain-containing protein [Brevinematia bacterium]
MPKRKNYLSLQKRIQSYLSKINAGEMVLPRPHIVICYYNSTPEEILAKFRKYKYSRLPVVDKNTEKIVGYIFFKDFYDKYIESGGKFKISEIIREIVFVPENMNGLDIFNIMKEKLTNIAVVVDEYGNHIGIITLEDILEKILGEILDESDNKEDEELEIEKISEEEYIVSAWAPVEQVASEIGMSIDGDTYENMDVRTISGFLMYITGSIPKYGSLYEYKNFVFKVIEVENNRPSKILIKRK